eukprot:3904378-Pleurochrysis_carterae.AAC.3
MGAVERNSHESQCPAFHGKHFRCLLNAVVRVEHNFNDHTLLLDGGDRPRPRGLMRVPLCRDWAWAPRPGGPRRPRPWPSWGPEAFTPRLLGSKGAYAL